MDKELSKAIALASMFTLAFSFLGIGYAGGGDYAFHFEKARNGCENLGEQCETYTPLFHFIAAPFTVNENTFFFFTVFLLAFVTPMLLFFIARDWLVVWLYFATTSYFWFFVDGIFAQALAAILFLLIFVVKDWRLRVAIVVLSIFAHGHGFFLTGMAFLVITFWEGIKDEVDFKKIKEKLSKVFLGCSGVFGTQRPEILDVRINGLVSTGSKFTIGHFLLIFTKIFPLPYFLLSVWFLSKDKDHWFYLFIALGALVGGFFVSHRIFYIMALVLLPGLTWFAKSLSHKHRIVFLLSTLLVFGFQLYSWLNFKLVCSV